MIVALTSLCKGLVGAIIPFIAVVTDIALQKSWKQHLRPALFFALIPAMIVYLLPFWASSHFGGEAYGESGLYLVYRENILRYFQPFDHQGSIYTYFIYLPIYMLPWAVFFIPALLAVKSRWKQMTIDSRWIAWTLLLLFAFFTMSGSRRSYYVLPMVPFAILFTADWILSSSALLVARRQWAAGLVVFSYVALLLVVDVVPAWYYAQYGVNQFAIELKDQASKIKPWQQWQVVMLDAESKLNFYLQLPPDTANFHIKGTERDVQTTDSLLQAWPVLKHKPANTIFISRKMYAPALQSIFVGYQMVELPVKHPLPFMKRHNEGAPVAFIPLNKTGNR